MDNANKDKKWSNDNSKNHKQNSNVNKRERDQEVNKWNKQEKCVSLTASCSKPWSTPIHNIIDAVNVKLKLKWLGMPRSHQ